LKSLSVESIVVLAVRAILRLMTLRRVNMGMIKIDQNWVDRLVADLGKNVNLVTVDGVVRYGKLTGFGTRSFVYNGKKIEMVHDIELNGDPSDRIELGRLEKVDIR
jgi:hypothetical protein